MLQLEHVLGAHIAIKDCIVAVPVGVNSQTNVALFSNTVTQKAERKERFMDLWRNFC